jgi:hypothetical protein
MVAAELASTGQSAVAATSAPMDTSARLTPTPSPVRCQTRQNLLFEASVDNPGAGPKNGH